MKTKNSKKVLALILSFFMILTVLPFNVMAEGNQPAAGSDTHETTQPAAKTTAELKQEAEATIETKKTEATTLISNIKDGNVKKQQQDALDKAFKAAQNALNAVTAEPASEDVKNAISNAKSTFDTEVAKIVKATNEQLEKEKAAETAEKAAQLRFNSYNIYYDAITGKVVDGNGNPVNNAKVSVDGQVALTNASGNFSLNMTSESGNYYCGYYGYYWKDYPYNSTYIGQTVGSYLAINNYSTGRYFFLVDSKGYVDDVKFIEAGQSYKLNGYSTKTYNVYVSDYGYGYGYGYGYPYYDKYYNRYNNPSTNWSNGKTLKVSMDGYTGTQITLGNVDTYSWLYTTCYEYGYPYGYDRVIYPSALSLSGNGTIVSGKVGVSYLPIYVYRNGVFLGSGNADVNGYFSIGLNSRVSSTSDLTFYAYGKGAVAPEKKSEKADHGVIPVKSTVVIGSTKLIKNINGVEADVNMDVAPFIKDGRTMLPLRYIAEALGFKVDWDRATRTVTLTDKEFKVQIPVETNKIIVNGSTYYSDANPVLRNGRTMLPVANIARALGLKDGTDILWDANTRVATITRLVKY